ncbi:MAG TPA: 30S ribosomal protein S16 [Gemmata sp.]|nr:30S ribosomal protein S16 [Gemmata sp.]
MAVRIRMKQMGRAHRHYYRIVAIDHRQPRDGRVIEELGVYDPHVVDKEARVKLRPSRIKYWQSVGAKASDQCQVIFNRFMKKWEELESQEATKVAEEAAKAKAIAEAEATAPLG